MPDQAKNLRKYGKAPFTAAVLHGGPGVPGGVAPVARELSVRCGTLEPLVTSPSLDGQLLELKDVLQDHAKLPITLIGHSWGAMFAFIFTAQNPRFVKKLVLVGSGLYGEKNVPRLMETRLNRLDGEERLTVHSLREAMKAPDVENKNELLARFGKLMARADNYDPLPYHSEIIEYQFHVFDSVWREARDLRKRGKLLELGRRIRCPVTAIHGDYDPHPADDIKESLSRVLKNFRFILLKNCGHLPWIEHAARDEFFRILLAEVG